MRDRGINIKEFIMVAGAEAKTVTNNLPLLTVLGFRAKVTCHVNQS
jgi:hypothetical protein